jgi:3-dehydroquinate dehydratase / shikimate dehydrogenase
LDVLEYGQKRGVPTMVLAMGEVGLWTRVLAGKCGSPFTFARGEGAPGTAPGQPTWTELVDLYRFHEIDKDTPLYSVIGNPIAHSRSPLMHNTALRENNLKGVYLPLKIEGDPVPVLKGLQRVGLRGTSVTIPHKENVQPLCAEIDPVAKQIGAINTLQLRGDGTWFGTNTDAIAAADSLVAKAGDLSGKTVAILGAGGAARALAFGVKQRGANVIVSNRTVEKAQSLAREVGGKAVALEELVALKPAVIVNTTPLGMHPNTDSSPLQKDQIPQGGIVFDTVYNPLRTKLLEFAEARGCTTLDGLEMFVGQGVRQFELWTGTTAPREIMRRVVLEALQQKK